MTIENLKQIAIKYATTKGSRVPLAPDELCNAVVQYMNSFFGVMTDINTIKVAVTEDSGNIVFTITGNTYDGKPITPIVITVDHNDFVTDQEFEEFKTTTNAAIQKNTESINSLSFRVEDTENDITTIQVQVGQINTRVGNTETNIAKINSTLNNKLDKITIVSNSNQVYGKTAGGKNLLYNLESYPHAGCILQYDNDGKIYVNKGSSDYTPANMQNIADVEAKIPDISNLVTTEQLQEVENKIPDTSNLATRVGNTETNIAKINSTLNNKLDKITIVSNSNQVYGKTAGGKNLLYNLESYPHAGCILQYDNDGKIYVNKGSSDYTPANMQNIADVEAKIPDISNLVTTEQLQEVENKIPDTSNLATKTELQEVESKIPDTTNFADVTKANTFADVNHFTQYITSFGVEIGTGNADDDEYDVSIQESGIEIFHYISGSKANSLRITENKIMTVVYPSNEYNIFNFPNKSGTLALTTDVIKEPIYFISFYANDPSEPCHLIGTMMSKNSYGTGQKTNEEFAVMLVDNLYTNSNEGLAVYGKLAGKDILCIYSEDGLSIRCLDETNSEVDLPMVMFFVMETEL